MARGYSGMGTNMGLGMNMNLNMNLGVSPGMGLGLLNGFASPAAFAGLDMATPSLLDPAAGGLGAGGQPMGLSLSDLGVSSKRNEDEERRTKLEGVLGRLLGKRKRGDDTGRQESGMGRAVSYTHLTLPTKRIV